MSKIDIKGVGIHQAVLISGAFKNDVHKWVGATDCLVHSIACEIL